MADDILKDLPMVPSTSPTHRYVRNKLAVEKVRSSLGKLNRAARIEAEKSLAVNNWRDKAVLAIAAGRLRSAVVGSEDGATAPTPLGFAQSLLEIVWQAGQTENGHSSGMDTGERRGT